MSACRRAQRGAVQRVVDGGVHLERHPALQPVEDDPGHLAHVRLGGGLGLDDARDGDRLIDVHRVALRARGDRRPVELLVRGVDHDRQQRLRGVVFSCERIGRREEIALGVALGVVRAASGPALARDFLVVPGRQGEGLVDGLVHLAGAPALRDDQGRRPRARRRRPCSAAAPPRRCRHDGPGRDEDEPAPARQSNRAPWRSVRLHAGTVTRITPQTRHICHLRRLQLGVPAHQGRVAAVPLAAAPRACRARRRARRRGPRSGRRPRTVDRRWAMVMRGAVGRQGVDGLLHGVLGAGVQGAGRLVEDEHGRVAQDGAGDGEALLLAAGEAVAALADEGVVPVGQGRRCGRGSGRPAAAARISSSVASGLAKRRLSATEAWKR